MKPVILFISVTSLASLAAQQAASNPEIFLAQINLSARPMISASLTNVSNNPGYDNQPSFLPDGSAVLFSSVRSGTQYDIYKYDVASQKVVPVTNSPDNENSPIVTPDGKTFSAVRSEVPIGAENQRLWRFNLDGSNPSVMLPEVRRIGYHVWVDATHLLLFVLGSPNSLQFADTATGTAEVIDQRIGRSLLLRPKTGTVTYISQPQDGRPLVKEFNPKTKQTTPLVEAVEGSSTRDCVWHPSGVLLMSAGTKVFAWTPSASAGTAATPAPATSWVEAGDFSTAGIANISRMSIGPGPNGSWRLALVAELVAK